MKGITIKKIITVLVLPYLLFFCQLANTLDGWNKKLDVKGNIVFSPEDLRYKSVITVKYYPRVALEKLSVEQWLARKLHNSPPPENGVWVSEAEIDKLTANFSQGRRRFTSSRGIKRELTVFAVSVDQNYVRLVASMVNRDLDQLAKTYKEQAAGIATDIIQIEKNEALKEGRKLDIEASPPKVSGLKAGGKLKPGHYVGNKIKAKTSEIMDSYEVILYENGEYEFVKGDDHHGHYKYSPLTGRLDIDRDFRNYSEDYCVYGIDEKTGQPTIFAKSGYLSNYVTKMTWQAPATGFTPDQIAKQIKKQRKEDKEKRESIAKARWSAPNQGVKSSDIEAITYHFDTYLSAYGNLKPDITVYLLLKDGTAYIDLDLPPSDFNIGVSRKLEPERWTQWQHQDDRYIFRNKKGKKVDMGIKVRPLGRQYLSANLSRLSVWGNIFMGSGQSREYITLMSDGRFEKSSSSLATSGTNSLASVSVATSSDKHGERSVSSGSSDNALNPGPNIGGSAVLTSKKKTNRKGLDKVGRYFVEGYTINFQSDSGRVSRELFFYPYNDEDRIYIGGATFNSK